MQEDILSFDPAVNQPELLRAWKEFISKGVIQKRVVPPIIAESWIRSRKAGVNPFDFSPDSYIDPQAYRQLKKRHKGLVDIARPIMESIYNSLEKTRYMVVLYNADGYHLLRIGKREDFARSQQFKIREGLCFEEKHVGTCGFSLVKHTKKPIQIVGCEHYSALLHYVTGSYAPIFEPEKGDLLGVIGVTGARTQPNMHTQAIVIAAKTAIENLLTLKKSRQKQALLAQSLQIAINSLEDGVVVLDENMTILAINNAARKIFGIRYFSEQHFSDLKHCENLQRLIDQHLNSMNQDSKETQCKINDETYVINIRMLHGQDKTFQGIVLQLRSVQGIARMFQNVSGQQAYYCLSNLIGRNESMIEVRRLVKIAAKTEANVIIEGESGTGKEVVAQSIHNESSRKNGPFIAVNCAAIPHELLESILFGHEKGAFTGANTMRLGKFELAHGGTLFLDEIGEMSPEMQAKVLRAIEERKIERVGGTRSIPVDIRIIAATNRDLYELTRKNLFREDLFYRLKVFRIWVPPLRDRLDDIPELVECFLSEFTSKLNIPKPEISDDYLSTLMSYSWPGNVRELKNAVYYSLAHLSQERVLTSRHLEGFFPRRESDRIFNSSNQEMKLLEVIEKHVIRETLKICGGNKKKAAQQLGISRATLYRKLRK